MCRSKKWRPTKQSPIPNASGRKTSKMYAITIAPFILTNSGTARPSSRGLFLPSFFTTKSSFLFPFFFFYIIEFAQNSGRVARPRAENRQRKSADSSQNAFAARHVTTGRWSRLQDRCAPIRSYRTLRFWGKNQLKIKLISCYLIILFGVADVARSSWRRPSWKLEKRCGPYVYQPSTAYLTDAQQEALDVQPLQTVQVHRDPGHRWRDIHEPHSQEPASTWITSYSINIPK